MFQFFVRFSRNPISLNTQTILLNILQGNKIKKDGQRYSLFFLSYGVSSFDLSRSSLVVCLSHPYGFRHESRIISLDLNLLNLRLTGI